MLGPSATPKQSTPMSQAELTARAIDRARTEHVHIFKTVRPNVYTTKSKSDPTERYTLVVDGAIVACSCKGYWYRNSCKHSEALRGRLARESRPRATAADLF